MNADRDRLHEPEHPRVGIDLNDLGLLRPVVEPVLRQGAKRAEARAEREHDIRLRDQLHCRFRALVAERPDRKRMRGRE